MNKNFIKKNDIINVGPNSNLLKAYKTQYSKLSLLQKEVSIGLILGDAYLYTRNNAKSFAIKFEWGNKSKDYIHHVYDIFDEFILRPPVLYKRVNINNNIVYTWRMETFTSIAFCELGLLFIRNNRKSILKNIVFNHLTPRGLAYWYMDDGNLNYYKGNRYLKDMTCVLNTQGFNVEEVGILIDELNNKFKLDCYMSFNKIKPIIVIPSKSYNLLYELISPFMINHFKYKLGC